MSTKAIFSGKKGALHPWLKTYDGKDQPTDIQIKVGKSLFPAHKIVLQESSPVFKALISKVWSNNNDGNVYELSEEIVDSKIVGDLLTFLYTSKVKLTEENAFPICVASNYLIIPKLQKKSEKFIGKTMISDNNFLNFIAFSCKYSLVTLGEYCVKYAFENSDYVDNYFDFSKIDLEDLMALIRMLNGRNFTSGKDLNEIIFEIAMKWVENDPSVRSSSLYFLLKSIPMLDLSPKFLKEIVAEKTIIIESPPCLELLKETFNKIGLKFGRSFEDINESNSPRIYCQDQMSQRYNVWNSYSGKWSSSTIKVPRECALAHMGTAVIESRLYLCPRMGTSIEHTDWMRVFDCETNTCKRLEKFPGRLLYCAVASLNGYVYCTGGQNNRFWTIELSRSAFRYSVSTNQFESVKPMLIARSQHELVELNGFLYAIGGVHEKNACYALTSVERYDPTANEWTMMADMNHYHHGNGAVAHNGKIYVVGTLSGTSEVYCPHTNTWSDFQTSFKDSIFSFMPMRQHTFNSSAQLVSINGRLLMLINSGGKGGVFELETSTKQWKRISDMNSISFVAQPLTVNFD